MAEKNNKDPADLGLSTLLMVREFSVLDTAAACNLINKGVIPPVRRGSIRGSPDLNIAGANNNLLRSARNITTDRPKYYFLGKITNLFGAFRLSHLRVHRSTSHTRL